jgi:U3 small nucleolar RNA-associated protein 18
MVHVPSKRVFANWPTDKTPLGYVQCLAFSPGGRYLGIGNDKGKALLYKVKHFQHY